MKLSFKPDSFDYYPPNYHDIPLLTGTTPIAWDTFKIPYRNFLLHTIPSIIMVSYLCGYLIRIMVSLIISGYLSCPIVDFLFFGIGKLLRIENVLLLFNAALFGEQLISVFGMYLLGTQIFKKRTTILF